ncbi:MAG: dihydrodipicolinate synthase family protein [Rhodospirillaceae bacterium]|nr:dihydrodipicolinate synthase family protein [Rhodospirillaceae bacterium]MBL6930884.1 dihydrodipicolinate synthase family protein [Rhodospirillales bacterium]MBL6941536.1 dihydrodipicolinate synthase family protein [Rhodospirillales bacterium]
MIFEGIIPPVITPLHDDHSIDEDGFAAVIEYMIEGGVYGIIVGGTTGEFYALSPEERIRQFQFAGDIINGRAQFVCGVNDISTAAACAYGEAARDAGADGLLVAAPYYSLPTEQENAAHCLAIDKAAGLPIMLYNYPGRTGVSMGEDYLDLVSKSPNIKAIKEASGDINRLHLLANNYPGIELSCGAEDQALEFFVWGATSWVTPMGNFFAEEVVALYDACVKEQNFVKARRIMAALLELTSVLEGGGQLIQCTKFACQFFDLPAGTVRPPLKSLPEADMENLRDVLTSARSDIQAILAEA